MTVTVGSSTPQAAPVLYSYDPPLVQGCVLVLVERRTYTHTHAHRVQLDPPGTIAPVTGGSILLVNTTNIGTAGNTYTVYLGWGAQPNTACTVSSFVSSEELRCVTPPGTGQNLTVQVSCWCWCNTHTHAHIR